MKNATVNRTSKWWHRRHFGILLAAAAFLLVASQVSARPWEAGAEDSPTVQAPPDSVPAGDGAIVVTSITPVSGTTGNITFKPGMRVQVRYNYDNTDNNNDFYIARTRIKGGGDAFGIASYYTEVKIDNVGRFNSRPNAQVENAWINFPITPEFAIRAGLYDMVFSRNALTSDSKLLLMDRSLIKDALTVLGLADNTVGVLAHGRPMAGHLTYGFGIFDNLGFETAGGGGTLTRKADGAMTTGRLAYDFLDPAPLGGYGDYLGTYIGSGQRLSLGANAAYLSKVQIGDGEYNLYAWGADLFFNKGPATIGAEYARYNEDTKNDASPSIKGEGWYAQAGYLVTKTIELAAQYQEFDPLATSDIDKLKWTSVGFNYYLRGHNFKIQADYTFKNEQGTKVDNDLFKVQLQLDY